MIPVVMLRLPSGLIDGCRQETNTTLRSSGSTVPARHYYEYEAHRGQPRRHSPLRSIEGTSRRAGGCQDVNKGGSSTSSDEWIEWQSFEEARDFARSLGLGSEKDWVEWRMSEKRPQDIPADPCLVYGGKGGPWQGWPDFLGLESDGSCKRSRWWPFEEARRYAWGLGLKSKKQWHEWSKSGQRPPDIPSNPEQVYKEEGWLSWGDFLGFNPGYVVGEWRAFGEARDFIRSLGLESQTEWFEWSKSGLRPPDIPSCPAQVYKGKGWLSWADFLGYNEGYVVGEWRSFQEARDYIRSLGLESQTEWEEWRKSGLRPPDIPSTPDQVYKGKGWLSWGDFLGYRPGHIAAKQSHSRKRSFTDARDYARSLGFKSYKEWQEWRKSGERPPDIPSDPDRVYKEEGWLSWGDFLGFRPGHIAVRRGKAPAPKQRRK